MGKAETRAAGQRGSGAGGQRSIEYRNLEFILVLAFAVNVHAHNFIKVSYMMRKSPQNMKADEAAVTSSTLHHHKGETCGDFLCFVVQTTPF